MSVVIPLYSPGALLEVALRSVTAQDLEDLEVILVDDAGPEPLRGRLEAAARADGRVKPVYHPSNRGLAAALNSGLANASGQYVLVLEQDCEIAHPDALSKAVAALDKDPTVCLTGRRLLPYEELSAAEAAFNVLRDHLPVQDGRELVPLAFTELKCDLFPRKALDKCGGFDASFRFSGEDQMLGFRLRQAGYRLLESKALAYTLRSVGMQGVRANLRREFTYGRTQAALLLRTSMGSLRSSAGVEQGARRVSNRAASTASGVFLWLAPVGWLATGSWLAALAFSVPAVVRMATVTARSGRIPRSFPARTRARAACLLLSPADDLVYATALAVGAIGYMATGRS